MSEPDVSNLLTVHDAITILDSTPVSRRIIRANLNDARDLRLAEDPPGIPDGVAAGKRLTCA